MARSEQVIDVDAHVVEPHDIWLRYLDEPLRDLANRTPGFENGNSTGNDGPESLFPLGFPTEMGCKDLLRLAAGSASRLTVMDGEGIDSVALFPTHSLRLGGVRHPKFAPALFRAYNDWLAEYCSANRERLLGVAMTPSRIGYGGRRSQDRRQRGHACLGNSDGLKITQSFTPEDLEDGSFARKAFESLKP